MMYRYVLRRPAALCGYGAALMRHFMYQSQYENHWHAGVRMPRRGTAVTIKS
jgi:hypothetical protein